MARHLSSTAKWTQYFAARLAVMGITLFDIRTNLEAATAVGRAMYRYDHRHRERTTRNIERSFPQMDRQQVDDLAMQSFEHLAKLVVEVCQIPQLIHTDSWAYRVRLKNLGKAADLLNSEKPVLLVTSHLGNWEVTGFLLTVLGYSISAIVRPLDNPLINDWLLGIRQRRGMRVITKWNATEQMLGVLKSGGSLGILADQNAGEKGLFVPFFGRLASSYKSIGLLALSQNIPIVCGYACRLNGAPCYEIGTTDVIKPEDWADQPDPLYYVTARYARAIEKSIKLFPGQYLWMHRRWKSRPPHERAGKPFPTSLRRKLEALPWMDQASISQLEQPLDCT